MHPVEDEAVELKHVTLPGNKICTGKRGFVMCDKRISGNKHFCLECSGNKLGNYSGNEVPYYV